MVHGPSILRGSYMCPCCLASRLLARAASGSRRSSASRNATGPCAHKSSWCHSSGAAGGSSRDRRRVGASPSAGTIFPDRRSATRSDEHTSELQSLMRLSYVVFCLQKQKTNYTKIDIYITVYLLYYHPTLLN